MKNNMKGEKSKMSRIRKVLLSLISIILIVIISFIIYEMATVNKTYYIGEKNLQIPIFVYHDIVKDESEVEHKYMQTTVDTFEKQITGIMKLGYKPISYEDLVKYKNGEIAIPKWSFLITFDDGYEGVYKYAYPIAQKYNIPMASFEINDCVGLDKYYDWQQAKEMNDSGIMSIYLHGFTHIEYNKEKTETLVNQTNEAYKVLQEKMGNNEILKVFTYPYGLHRKDEIDALANEGYIENLTDNKINQSSKLNLSELHRCYPLSDSVFKILLKIQYRSIKYSIKYGG